MSKKSPGIRCTECGCRLDPGERCDCKKNPEAILRTQRIVAHNQAVVKTAFSNERRINQAYLNFDYK